MKVYESFLGRALCSVILALFLDGCGSPMYPELQAPPQEDMSKYLPVVTEVSGSAAFGAHCNYGTFQDPVAVPLELYNCPMGLSVVELEKQLPAMMFQVDCRKRTLDIRGPTLDTKMTTWEFLPDGHFWIAIDGGYAQLKEDGAGNTSCVTPLVAELWGSIDCADMDKAKIHLETVWWLDKNYNTLIGTSGPGPSTAPSSFPGPSATPTDPMGGPTASPMPSQLPTMVPSTPPAPLPSPETMPTVPTVPTTPYATPSPYTYPYSLPTSPMPAPSFAVPTWPNTSPSPNYRPWLYFRGMKTPHLSLTAPMPPLSSATAVDSPFPGATATPGTTIPRDLPRCKMPVSNNPNSSMGCYFHSVNHFKMCQ